MNDRTHEEENNYHVDCDLVGVLPENINLILNRSTVSLVAEQFMGTFSVPPGVVVDAIDAQYDGKILRVVFKKGEGWRKSRKISVHPPKEGSSTKSASSEGDDASVTLLRKAGGA